MEIFMCVTDTLKGVKTKIKMRAEKVAINIDFRGLNFKTLTVSWEKFNNLKLL